MKVSCCPSVEFGVRKRAAATARTRSLRACCAPPANHTLRCARAPIELGVAEGGHQRTPHFARRHLAHRVEQVARRLGVEALAPAVLGADAAVEPGGDAARGVAVGRAHLVDVHAVEDRVGIGAAVVRGREPNNLARVDRHLGELVGEAAGGAVFEQAIDPAGRHQAHRQKAHAGAEQHRELACEMGLAGAGRAEQQQRGDLERVARVFAKRKLAADVVEQPSEVGHLVKHSPPDIAPPN